MNRHSLSNPFLVGVSGGRDSWSLLAHLLRLLDDPDRLVVVHYHHDMADHGTEAYRAVRDWCLREDLTFVAARRTPGSLEGNEEARARELRYEFFQRVARTLGVMDLVVAHHRRDQVETILLNQGRGSGLVGLGGMREVHRRNGLRIHRPLLGVDPAVLHNELPADVPVVDDPDNQRRDRARTMLRHEVLPRWREVQPDPESGILTTGHQARETNRYLDQLSDERVRYWRFETEVQFSVQDLRDVDELLGRHVFRRAISWLPSGISGWNRGHFEDLYELATGGRSGAALDLPGPVRARRERGRLALYEIGEFPEPRTIQPSSSVTWPRAGRLEVSDSSPGDGGFPVESFLHLPNQDYDVRFWSSGDRIQASGGGTSVKELFDDRRVPYRARRRWPVVVGDQGLLAVPGLAVRLDAEDRSSSSRGSYLSWFPHHPSYHQWLTERCIP